MLHRVAPQRIAPGNSKISVAAFTQGLNGPSARFRVRQLIEPLASRGVVVDEFMAKVSSFPPVAKWKRPGWLLNEIGGRIPQLLASRKYDLSIIQREFISTFPSLEIFARGPRIFDVDDAIWLYRRGFAANLIARHSDHIVCGNDFLANYFSAFTANIDIIPTAVDVERFVPRTGAHGSRLVIGWSGTSGGYKFFDGLEQPLRDLLLRNPDWVLRIVSDCPPNFSLIPESQIEFVRWTAENESRTIAEMDIGLMPLDDSMWSRGKCSYKMLLYMACGVPVVVSDVGMNAQVIRQAEVGMGVLTPDEWIGALEYLMGDEQKRRAFGINGRQLILERYSLDAASSAWAGVVQGAVYGK